MTAYCKKWAPSGVSPSSVRLPPLRRRILMAPALPELPRRPLLPPRHPPEHRLQHTWPGRHGHLLVDHRRPPRRVHHPRRARDRDPERCLRLECDRGRARRGRYFPGRASWEAHPPRRRRLGGQHEPPRSFGSPRRRRRKRAARGGRIDRGGGRRDVNLRRIPLQEWSHVSATTLGSGTPGTVTLESPRIVVDGGAVITAAVDAPESAGGAISLEADEVRVRNGSRLDASTFVDGPGGTVDVAAAGSIVVEGAGSGIASRTGGVGIGGQVLLSAPVIRVSEGGEVPAKSETGLGPVGQIFRSLLEDGLLTERATPATGDAGSIALTGAQQVLLSGGGRIATSATSENANGGDVAIRAQRLVHLDDSEITASVGGGTGGNITIDPAFMILENGSSIAAKAGAGSGGRIVVTADNYFAFPGSGLDASAGNPALSGTVEVHSPDVDLAGTLTPLPSAFLDAASLMRERCAARRSGERAGTFSVRGPGGIPSEPDGWLRAPLVLEASATPTAAVPGLPALVASLPGPLLAHAACP